MEGCSGKVCEERISQSVQMGDQEVGRPDQHSGMVMTALLGPPFTCSSSSLPWPGYMTSSQGDEGCRFLRPLLASVQLGPQLNSS